MKKVSCITVLGAGYVGLTTAALLAQSGYKVFLVEPNQKRLKTIQSGESFFFEEGINPIIKKGVDEGSLIATDSYSESVPASQVVFSCVGTPDKPDGSSDLGYVFAAAEESANHMKPGTVYVQKSTVPVGTGTSLIEKVFNNSQHISYVSNPEFLREGTAVYDTLFFDRVVAGGSDTASVELVLDIYRQLEANRDQIAELSKIESGPRKGLYISTKLNSAELIKVTANAFLALKLSFANSIAILADRTDADVVEVMDAVGADERIGRAFLNAGRGYGGGCFPKDVSGLIASAIDSNVNLEIMQAVQSVNKSMPGYIVEKLNNRLGSLNDKRVAVLGLAFKAGTSDARKSPGVAIANLLARHGATVIAFDPQANEEASHDLSSSISLVDSAQQAIDASEVVVIATDWPEFEKYVSSFGERLVLDAVNMLKDKNLPHYMGIGR